MNVRLPSRVRVWLNRCAVGVYPSFVLAAVVCAVLTACGDDDIDLPDDEELAVVAGVPAVDAVYWRDVPDEDVGVTWRCLFIVNDAPYDRHTASVWCDPDSRRARR